MRVTIFNQTYTLAATGEAGEVEALAHTVDELMTDIAQRAGNVWKQHCGAGVSAYGRSAAHHRAGTVRFPQPGG